MSEELHKTILRNLKLNQGQGQFKTGVLQMIAEKSGLSLVTVRNVMHKYRTTHTWQTKEKIWDAARFVANHVYQQEKKYS